MLKSKKILSLNALNKRIVKLKKQGKKIAWTNGCFDILHAGHVSYLKESKKKDRILIVGLNSDKSVQKLKGRTRPIVPEIQRAFVLSELECVDFIVLFDQETPYEAIKYLKPDILIKGADYKGKPVAGEDVVLANGGKLEFIKYLDRMSTTNIIEKILKCKK